MKKLLLLLLPFTVFLFPSVTSAQTRLQYPIPDLGYCRDAKECSLYCQIPENKAPCWSYGKYKLGTDVLGVTTMGEEEKRQMQQKAKQYNITFPIVDLGNCAGPQECRDFCEQLANQSACMDFAKKKGFQKEMDDGSRIDRQKKDELIEKAKTELGCTSMEDCSKICESDHTRCEAFARKHGVYQEPSESRSRYSAEEKVQLMQKAQSELGCTSMESCKSSCEKNPERCMKFAKKHRLDIPEKQEDRETVEREEIDEGEFRGQNPMSGKCDSEDSCKTYCREHPNECPGFQSKNPETQTLSPSNDSTKKAKTNYVGPSGCRTEAECKSWCTDHPDTCPGFSEGKQREEQSKLKYELRKKEMENQQETQKRQFETNREMLQQNYEYRQYPTTFPQPTYQTTQSPTNTYSTPATLPATP